MDPDLDRRLSELMRRAQEGDRGAYETLLGAVAAQVRGFAIRRLRRVDSAEDVVQDTLLSIHRARHTYDPARPFGPWMYAIARHRLLDLADRQRRRGETEILGHAGIENLGQEETPAADPLSAGLLGRAMARLTVNQRQVIQMLKLEERSVAEVSQKTGLSISAVKVTAHRGYRKLRELIARTHREQ